MKKREMLPLFYKLLCYDAHLSESLKTHLINTKAAMIGFDSKKLDALNEKTTHSINELEKHHQLRLRIASYFGFSGPHSIRQFVEQSTGEFYSKSLIQLNKLESNLKDVRELNLKNGGLLAHQRKLVADSLAQSRVTKRA